MSQTLAPLQILLATALALTSDPSKLVFLAFAIPAAGLLGWAVATMGPGNFSVHPELVNNAKLITHGPYRWVRHPMYSALLIAAIGFVSSDPRIWRIISGIALLVVLMSKARIEEQNVTKQFSDYAAYKEKTSALLPFVY